MQIVSSLHEMSNPVFCENYEKTINVSSSELAQSMVQVKVSEYLV